MPSNRLLPPPFMSPMLSLLQATSTSTPQFASLPAEQQACIHMCHQRCGTHHSAVPMLASPAHMHTEKMPCFPHTVAAQSSSTRFTHSIHHLAVLTTHHSTNAHAQMLHTTTQPRTLTATVLHNCHAPTCCRSVQESSWLMHAGPVAAIELLLLHIEHAPCQWYSGHCSTRKALQRQRYRHNTNSSYAAR